MVDMLYAEVDALLDVAVADDLVYNHTHSRKADVVYNSSSPVVVFVGHALLLRRIGLDVDDISYSVVYEEGREFCRAAFLKTPLEHMARTRPVTK